jgi:hypothetical protein
MIAATKGHVPVVEGLLNHGVSQIRAIVRLKGLVFVMRSVYCR